ncbi:MAG: hypothetical protein IJT77_13310 [Clostridia bacterium]|nr:hypothetical protein [Clostridia bacterium]
MQKIKPGLQPDQLSDASLVAFIVKNKDVKVIKDFLELWIAYNIQMTGDTRAKQLKEGKPADEAVAHALLKYGFRELVALYFKLTGEKVSDEYVRLMEYTVRVLAANEKVDASGIPVEWSLENAQAFETWIESLTTDYEAKLADAEKERKSARVSLDENRRELSKLKSQLMQAENGKNALQQTLNATKQQLNEAHSLLQKKEEALQSKEEELKQKEEAYKNNQGPVTALPLNGTDVAEKKTYAPAQDLKFMSLCRPYVDERGVARLLRLADVGENGEILDNFVEDAPQLYRLYQKDGPEEDNYIGVWDWKSVPNIYNPAKVYFICAFHEHMEPIEIIIPDNVHSVPELVESLQAGIDREHVPDRMLYAFNNGTCYEGVYLTYSKFDERDKKSYLGTDVQSLPVHRFMASDITHIENATYYRYIDLPPVVGMVNTRENMEIVKSIMLAKVLWPVMKDQGFSRADYKMIKDFVAAIPTADVFDRISKACDCSRDEAKRLADRFIANGERYMNDVTIGSDEASRLVQNSPALMEACMAAVESTWRSKNEEKIKEAEARMADLDRQEEHRKSLVAAKQDEFQHIEAEVHTVREQLKELENRKQEMEAVSEALEKQTKALEAQHIEALERSSETPDDVPDIPIPMGMPLGSPMMTPMMEPGFFDEMPWHNGDMMENNSWQDVLVSVEIALLEAGVAQYALDGLAACLYSAYMNRIPLIIAGPNSCDIVRAFSIAVEGMEPAVMRSAFEPAPIVVRRCRESRTNIVMIEQPLNSGWGGELFELLAQHNKFFVAVHPFAEDLKTVQRGMLNYFLPIMSELFVEKAPGDNYRGAQISDMFSALPTRPLTEHHNNFMRLLRVSTLTKNNLDRLLTDMHSLLESVQADDDYMFLLYPLAYMTGSLGILKENLGKTQTESPVSLGIRNFLAPYLKDE